MVRSVLLLPDMKSTVFALRCTVNQDNSADAADQLSFDVTNEVDNIESSRNVLRMPKSVISTETCVSHPLARAIVFYWASY